MIIHIGVDLGKWKIGWAVGTTAELIACNTTTHPRAILHFPKYVAATALVDIKSAIPAHLGGLAERVILTVEWPNARPNDLVVREDIETLKEVGRALITTMKEAFGKKLRVVKVAPSAWKGTLPKPVHHKRLQLYLNPQEQQLLADRPSTEHDTVDAVGLYLFGSGRTGRAATPPRSFQCP